MEDEYGEYTILLQAGSGGLGQVYIATKKTDNKAYILKIIKQKSDVKQINSLNREIKILKELNIPQLTYDDYIPILYDSQESKTNPYFTIDFFSKKNLYEYLSNPKHPNGLSEKYAKVIFKKIVKGIEYCHNKNICHLDIKPGNIMFDKNFIPKIIDFGLSRKYLDNNNNIIKFKGHCGSPNYQSPEMLEKNEFYGVESDIVSLGATLFNLVTGKPGFKVAYKNDVFYKYIIEGTKNNDYSLYWQNVAMNINNKQLSDDFKNLYIKMIAYNPKDRPTIAQILSSSWLNEISNLSPEQNNNLENEVRNELTEIYNDIIEINNPVINIENKLIEYGYTTRSLDNKDNKFFIDSDIKPKIINEKRLKINPNVKINGYLNILDFMNSLAEKIFNINNNNYIEADKKNLKMKVIFEKEEDEIECEEKKEENKIENEENKIEDESNKECEMDIELFEYENGGYLLEFLRTEGDIQEFYDHFLEIRNIIINELLDIIN